MSDTVERMAERGIKLTLVDGKKVRLLPEEKRAMARIEGQRGFKIETIYRRSDKPFDLQLDGTHTFTLDNEDSTCRMSAWLPLLAIREFVLWTHPLVAERSEYPGMAMEGDWSGIRDSSAEQIWDIFFRWGKEAIFGRGELAQR